MYDHHNISPGRIEQLCHYCQKPFTVKRCVVLMGRGRFCSHACHDAAKIRPPAERLWERVEKTETCWLWTGSQDKRGYGRLNIGKRGEGLILAHRLSYELHYGPIPDGLFVCHHCDSPPCVNPAHLFLGDAKDNFDDLRAKGLDLRGEQYTHAKLTTEQVLEIRHRYKQGDISQSQLAREFGVSRGAIDKIVCGKNWAHLLDLT